MSWKDNAQRQRQQWKAPFCGCFDDMSSCLLSFCCPCVQYGFNAAKIDGSGCFGACCMYACCMACAGYQCAIGGAKRTSMRNMYMLEESCCCDCCVHWCCCCCALSQEARELEIRGPPPPQTMGSPSINIHNVNQTGAASPTAVMMPGPNGQLVPVQNGASQYVIGPNGQPMMIMYAPPPAAYSTSPQGATGSIPMTTYTGASTPTKPEQLNYNDDQQLEGQYQHGETITTLHDTTPYGSTKAA